MRHLVPKISYLEGCVRFRGRDNKGSRWRKSVKTDKLEPVFSKSWNFITFWR